MEINGKKVDVGIDEESGVAIYSYFACTCDDENKAFWEKAASDYFEELQTDPVSYLVMDLTHTYSAAVKGIGCDMWFGVSISAGYGKWVGEGFVYTKECDLYIQCDEVQYGLLTAVMILKELGYDVRDE